MMREVFEEGRGHASGKVILLGEHAVVYGTPAIAASLAHGARAVARRSETNRLFLGNKELPQDDPLHPALERIRTVLGAPPVELRLELDLPPGCGLGASAALGVASARALADLSGQSTSQRRISEAADAWEKVFHGTPSGVDRSAAQENGVLRFVRGQEPEKLVLRRSLFLTVAVASPAASTRDMIDNVARLRSANPDQFDKNLEAIRSLVDNATACLRSGDIRSTGRLMDLCQMILSGWMLSTEGIELACAKAREAGALGAKLTGAGGGGCIVALCENDAMSRHVQDALLDLGLEAFATRVPQ